MSEIKRNLSSFSAAPNGWRVAIADSRDKVVIIVHVVAWAHLADDTPYAHTGDGDLDPIVLWDNVGEPFVSILSQTIDEWNSGQDKGRHRVHQILPPGYEPRDVLEGWTVRSLAP